MAEMFRQNDIGARQRIIGAGHLIGVRNTLSHFSAEGAVKNALDGDVAVEYIHQLAKDPVSEMPELKRLANRLIQETMCRSRMIVGITSTGEKLPERMISAFPEAETYQLYRDYLDNFRINTGR